MYRDHKIGLLLPAYNEEENIGKVLGLLPDYIDFLLVVDDGSADQTAGIAKKHGAHVISHKSNNLLKFILVLLGLGLMALVAIWT